MKKYFFILLALAVIGYANAQSSASRSGGSSEARVYFQKALGESAQKTADILPPKSRIVILSFESENEKLSDHVIEEISGELFDMGFEIADRRGIKYILQEILFQQTEYVDETTAHDVSKLLAADISLVGSLADLRNILRYKTNATIVSTEKPVGDAQHDIRADAGLRRIIADMTRRKTVVTEARYMVSKSKTPQTAGTFLDRGIMFAMQGEYVKAIADFDEAIRLNPDMVAAYMLRARALYSSASHIINVLENFSGTIAATIGEIASPEQALILDRAIADYTHVISLEPDNAFAYSDRGWAYSNKGDYDRAITDYTQAIRLNPSLPGVYTNRSLAYKFKGDYDRAIADCTQAIQIAPDYFMAYINRGVAYVDIGEYDRAIADYTQAIRLIPNHAIAYYNRGIAYRQKGDYDRAIADYTQAIRLIPNYPDAYNNRGFAYQYGKRNYNRAIADYTKAIRLFPNHAIAYYNRAFAYHNGKRDYDRAIADYTQAIRIIPNFVLAYVNRGVAYQNKRDYNRSIADFEAALRIDPNRADAKNNLEFVRRQRGR